MLALLPMTDCDQCVLGRASAPAACPFSSTWREAGSLIFPQGAQLESIYFVRRGQVLLSTNDAGGNELSVSRRGVGSVLGWDALRGTPTRCLAVALTAVELCMLSVERLPAWSGDSAQRSRAVLDLALDEIQRHTEEKWLLNGSASSRLARFLVMRHTAGLSTWPLEIEHQLLARILGMRPETLSRAEHKLRELGLVESGRQLFIADLPNLVRLSDGLDTVHL